MTLKLRVTGYDAQHMGAVAEHEFGENGGSIGRGTSNDWCLPDPDRVISSIHAVVRFSNGEYYLRDASTNGTLLNAIQLSRGDERPLSNGDVLRIGKFDIAVEVAARSGISKAAGSPQRPIIPNAPAGNFDPGASLDPLELLGGGLQSNPPNLPPEGFDFASDSSQSDHSAPEAMGFEPPSAMPDPDPAATGGNAAFEIPDNWDETGLKQSPPARKPAASSSTGDDAFFSEPQPSLKGTVEQPRMTMPQPTTGASTMNTGNRGDIDEMLRAAGVPPDLISDQTYAVLGQIIQVVVQGLLDVLRARAQIKDEFRVAATRLKPVENNPLKFSVNAQDALHNLFGKQNPGFQSPVDAFQESFEDIKAHQMAMIAGMRAAYDAMLDYFNPDGLETEFDKGLKSKMLGGVLNKSKYWDLYEDLFKQLQHDPDSSFHRLFGDEFGRAYEEQMTRLSRMRHK